MLSSFALNVMAGDWFWIMGSVYVFSSVAIGISLFLAGFVRLRITKEVRKQCKTNPDAYLGFDDKASLVHLPKVSVIMPCKGVHAGSLTNWRNQLSSIYPNAEFIFATESTDDPAYIRLQELMAEESMKHLNIKVVAAGLSWHCGQKIANLIEAISRSSPESRYVLLLDDDVALHPGTIHSLVKSMEDSNGKAFCVSGYSFDVPSSYASMWMYGVFLFRIINLTAFTPEEPAQVWGGCMLLRREDFWSNRYNIVDHWRDGGYSDDNIINAVASQMNQSFIVKRTSVFPNVLSSDRGSWSFYWNFLRRQVYALNTSSSEYSRVHNRRLLLTIFMLSVMFSVSLYSVCLHSLFVALTFLYPASYGELWEIDSFVRAARLDLAAVAALIFFFASIQTCVYCVCGLVSVLNPARRLQVPAVSHLNLLAAYFVHLIVLPYCCIDVYFRDTITWSGTRYDMANGRVVKVYRTNEKGELYSESREESLRRFVANDASKSFPRREVYERNV